MYRSRIAAKKEVHMSSNSSDIRTNKLVFTALMTCLVLLGTILFRIPIPMTQGYVHLGDAMIYIGVLLLGKKYGAVAAALGSSLGDVLGGFAFGILRLQSRCINQHQAVPEQHLHHQQWSGRSNNWLASNW